jgi:hypothetical protein
MDTADISRQLALLAKAAEGNRTSTAKLLQAAMVVGNIIEDALPVDVELPRHYVRSRLRSRHGSVTLLYRGCGHEYQGPCDCVGTGAVNCNSSGYLHDDFSAPELQKTTRAVALAFAKDVEEGLVGELAAFLDQRTRVAESAAAVLSRAATDLSSSSPSAP